MSNQLRLSPTRISEFTNCPQLYKYRAIDKLPEPLSIDAERGTLIHAILHDLFESPAGERTFARAVELLPLLWRVQTMRKPELVALITSEKEWFDRVKALLKTYFLLEKPDTFEATHRELHLENDLSEDLYLHGYVDRLDIAPTGEVRIIDYKSGKAPKPGWEEKALFQLRVYALLYWRIHQVIPKLLQLIYLGDGKLVRSVPTEGELLSTERKIFHIAQEILRATEENQWKPRPSKLCDWCYFKPICPAHQS